MQLLLIGYRIGQELERSSDLFSLALFQNVIRAPHKPRITRMVFDRSASAENSAWIVGRATFTEEIVNGPMKDVRVVTKRADFSKDLSSGNSCILRIHKLALIY